MKKWDVIIIETLSRIVSVEAESGEEAKEIVDTRYEQCEIMLNADDHILTEITAEHEGICPLCGAEITYSGNNIIDNNGGIFPWECPACGAHGNESYSRKFSGHLYIKKGKKCTHVYGS